LREKLESFGGDASGDEGVEPWKAKLEKYKHAFEEAMNEDFNTAGAIAVLFNLSKEVNSLLNSGKEISKSILSGIDSFYMTYGGNVLGIIPEKAVQYERDEEDIKLGENLIKALIDTRDELRASKNWELADKIRNRLDELGIVIEDKKEKVAWRKK
jgi:cysteinyl-tRNA synthetase